MKLPLVLLLLLTSLSCDKKKYFDGPSTFIENFESYDSIEKLIDGKNERWSYFQNTVNQNSITLDSLIAHSGKKSIHFYATTKSNTVSKASVAKQKMAFWEGDIMVVEAFYYIKGNQNLDWLFLMDLEEQAAIGAGPGMRLALVENKIRVEHKYFNKDIIQKENESVEFPRDKWVNIRFVTLLSKKKKGYVKIYQDDRLIIEQQNWKTLPTDFLYFQQGTKGMYSSIEFGITANSSSNSVDLYLDDINCYKK